MAEKGNGGIDPKYLKGLTFKTSEGKKEKDGKVRYTPVERDLTVDDVLSCRDAGDAVVIVTKDGQKYTVKKGK